MAIELNTDGLAIHFGPRGKGGANTASPETDGIVNEIVLDVDFESLNKSVAGTVMGVPLADLALRSDLFALPAGSSIVALYTQVRTPFVGGTFVANLVTMAGAAVPGVSTVATGAVTGAANVVSAAGVETTVDTYLDAKASGVLTAGSARVTLRYVSA